MGTFFCEAADVHKKIRNSRAETQRIGCQISEVRRLKDEETEGRRDRGTEKHGLAQRRGGAKKE